jgi:hypothetical protein
VEKRREEKRRVEWRREEKRRVEWRREEKRREEKRIQLLERNRRQPFCFFPMGCCCSSCWSFLFVSVSTDFFVGKFFFLKN